MNDAEQKYVKVLLQMGISLRSGIPTTVETPNSYIQSTMELTRAPLGYLAESAPLGEGGRILPPLPNSRTRGGSEVGEAANESFRWVLFQQI